MRNVVIHDIQDYVERHFRLIVASVAAAVICYGFLVFSGNIRIDTEELLNNPGSSVGWMNIGRFGLVLLKRLLGLSVHHVWYSGVLFFVFFLLGANLLTFALYHFSGRNEVYPYWVFLLLYGTSNIWCFQIYFSLQQAEIALAMLLLAAAAMLSVRMCFLTSWEGRGRAWNVLRAVLSGGFLFLGLGAYQALAVYYVAVCLMLFLVMITAKSGSDECDGTAVRWRESGKLLPSVLGLILHFVLVYILYTVYVNVFMTTSDYMDGQMGWGRLPAAECVKNVLRTAKNLLFANGPRNFSFLPCGVVIVIFLAYVVCRRKCAACPDWTKERVVFFLLGLFGILASPFLMTAYMGEMLVTRSQFALPVAAAFLGMYGIGGIREYWQTDNGRAKARLLLVIKCCVIAVLVIQCGYNFRLAYTDHMRCVSDEKKTGLLLSALREAGDGVMPKQPVIFVGYQGMERQAGCRRTEMYGWSFFEWDYSPEAPTAASHRISGFVQAHTGQVLPENATEEQRKEAVKLTENMPDFPAEGSVRNAGDFVVVRLSEVSEKSAVDWW